MEDGEGVRGGRRRKDPRICKHSIPPSRVPPHLLVMKLVFLSNINEDVIITSAQIPPTSGSSDWIDCDPLT